MNIFEDLIKKDVNFAIVVSYNNFFGMYNTTYDIIIHQRDKHLLANIRVRKNSLYNIYEKPLSKEEIKLFKEKYMPKFIKLQFGEFGYIFEQINNSFKSYYKKQMFKFVDYSKFL